MDSSRHAHLPQATDVLIIGGGPGGMSAAYTCQNLGISHLLVEASLQLGGQLSWTQSDIGGLITTSQKAPQEVREQLIASVSYAGCRIITNTRVLSLNIDKRTATLTRTVSADDDTASEKTEFHEVQFRKLVMATGSKERTLGVLGEDLAEVYGAHFSASQNASQFAGQKVVVVGGGDRALEGALHCANAGSEVTLVHRRQTLSGRQAFRDEVAAKPRIEVLLGTVVEKFEPAAGADESALRVYLRNVDNGERQNLLVHAAILRIGMTPEAGLIRPFVDCASDGVVVTDRYGRTSQPDIYAVGDAATPTWGCSLATAIGQGALAARHIWHSLTE